MILKIDLSQVDLRIRKFNRPQGQKVDSVMFNLYGLSVLNAEHLRFMAETFLQFENCSRYLINVEDKLQEELKVFCKVHDVRITK